ncbi:regulator RcnB of Ni and Co efflux [Izhakiella capsodis]|uniref:Regulator RcnB of Ni and Co efflux n=1 Tax=Izhakiella capsodis TaxID=1367852 RepID=A0A1I4XDQ4_9GAMM|nr:RcnB family protein [Izhakiella capsodis]SFN23623.1 regulator RcnB of Ni and Co efflux [Izhakiella capsodis]
MHKTKKVLCTAFMFSTVLALTSCAKTVNQQSDIQQAASVEQAQADVAQSNDAAQASSQQKSEQPHSFPHNVQAQNGTTPGESSEIVPGPQNDYEVKSFFADYKKYIIGDIVPPLYRTKPYYITDYKVRHLPAPQPDSHWTYMGGNYVLISNGEGKILQAKAGEIFYH